MRFIRGVFSALNRPLPAWLTLLLFCLFAGGVYASVPVFHGSLSVPVGGSITDANARANSCVRTDESGRYSYRSCTDVNSSITIRAHGVGPKLHNVLVFQNTAASKPGAADSIGMLRAYASMNSACKAKQLVSAMWPGVVGTKVHNYGGYWAFWTKNDGACDGGEVLVLDAQQHIYMPNDTSEERFSTAGACKAGIACTTYTFTFKQPFLTITGVPQIPRCGALGIRDENDPSQIWVGNIKSVSSKEVVYNVAPSIDVARSHTLDVYATCHDQSY